MTREDYNAFNIHTLRIIGREIGVKAPTMLSKSDLIEQIIAVGNGLIVPASAEQKKKGRPTLSSNLSLINNESEMQKTALQPCPKKKAQHVNENRNRNYQTQRRYDFVLQRIKTIEGILAEIFDYLIYEGL